MDGILWEVCFVGLWGGREQPVWVVCEENNAFSPGALSGMPLEPAKALQQTGMALLALRVEVKSAENRRRNMENVKGRNAAAFSTAFAPCLMAKGRRLCSGGSVRKGSGRARVEGGGSRQ